jgi:hypothetical protein
MDATEKRKNLLLLSEVITDSSVIQSVAQSLISFKVFDIIKK